MNADTPTSTPDTRGARLLGEFSDATYAQWRTAAEALLKGAPFEKKLITRTPEGIELQPIYNAADVAGLPQLGELPGSGNRTRAGRTAGQTLQGWEISQELPLPTPEEFNAAALADLERGQSELNIPLDLATLAGRDPDNAAPGEVGACGLSISTLADMERAFAGIHLPMISVYLRAGASALPAAALLFALARERGNKLDELRGCIEVDPLAMIAWKGDLPVSLARAYDEMASLTRYAIEHTPNLQTIAVQGHPYHDAGATAVQELAFALATGVEYLREMQKRGVSIDETTRHVRFALSAGSNFFMEVAKFRAARSVWSQAVRALGGSPEAQRLHLHVRTSIYNKTAYDAYSNMLRTTTEALSAVVGGCNGLHVGPFDEVYRLPDEFSRRIARNTQTILAEECDLTKVIDPAGGSYYVEWLTDQIARRAWTVFQEIEKAGGMARALEAGYPQKAVATTAALKADAVAKRRTIVVGANQYPNARESAPERKLPDYSAIQKKRAKQVAAFRTKSSTEADTKVMNRLNDLLESHPGAALESAIDAVLDGATLGEICRTLRAADEPHTKVTPLCIHRAAQPFERLRDNAAAYAAKHGTPPLLFQANIGPSRLYRLRADWTSSFFEVGGFKLLNDRDFAGTDDAAAAALASGAQIAVITSSDDTYATVVEPLAKSIKAANPGLFVLVAGAPKETADAWRAAGVDEFVNVTSNSLELLTRLQAHAQVNP
ncbi:methylmalonyl-CoA mutase family protein [Opitutales bacterium ASA1]|uniref:methylmalonyl-CoA mutase family protein n=1 Tax=Congregicoccus parvus TaxID=3081749 RepID=UPI002B295282|nr:methylmalonyl-CoA mutase family protein [Opitutales bacterium ASA1]